MFTCRAKVLWEDVEVWSLWRIRKGRLQDDGICSQQGDFCGSGRWNPVAMQACICEVPSFLVCLMLQERQTVNCFSQLQTGRMDAKWAFCKWSGGFCDALPISLEVVTLPRTWKGPCPDARVWKVTWVVKLQMCIIFQGKAVYLRWERSPLKELDDEAHFSICGRWPHRSQNAGAPQCRRTDGHPPFPQVPARLSRRFPFHPALNDAWAMPGKHRVRECLWEDVGLKP